MSKEYRTLTAGETLQAGDQFMSIGVWVGTYDIGKKVPRVEPVYRRLLSALPPVVAALRDMILLAQSEYPRTEWEERGITEAVRIYRETYRHTGTEPDPRVE